MTTNCSPADVLANLGTADCVRVTWNYQIFAAAGKPVAQKRISIWSRHDIHGKWEYPFWKRLCLLKLDMACTPSYWDGSKVQALSSSTADQKKLRVEDDVIVFEGGFLTITDPGLMEPLKPYLRRDEDGYRDGLVVGETINSDYETNCEPFEYVPISPITIIGRSLGITSDDVAEIAHELRNRGVLPVLPKGMEVATYQPEPIQHVTPFGRNIHIEAEFDDEKDERWQPLFYFPQDDKTTAENLGNVFLGLGSPNDPRLGTARQLYWAISHDDTISDPFDLGDQVDKHMVLISQDVDWRAKALQDSSEDSKLGVPYFEMMIDSIGIGDSARRAIWGLRSWPGFLDKKDDADFLDDLKGKHTFGSGERDFYVGFSEQDPHKNMPGWGGRTFRGNLHRLFFDPNTNCDNC